MTPSNRLSSEHFAATGSCHRWFLIWFNWNGLHRSFFRVAPHLTTTYDTRPKKVFKAINIILEKFVVTTIFIFCTHRLPSLSAPPPLPPSPVLGFTATRTKLFSFCFQTRNSSTKCQILFLFFFILFFYFIFFVAKLLFDFNSSDSPKSMKWNGVVSVCDVIVIIWEFVPTSEEGNGKKIIFTNIGIY